MVNLPYIESAVARRTTHTITLPITTLVADPQLHRRARVLISAVGREESVSANNDFTIYLGGREALRFVRQPVDVIIQEGEDAAFSVAVTGGRNPYRYQWQVWDPRAEKWVDLPGFTDAVLSRKGVEKKWDGTKFRCVVTDAEGAQIISEEATLTVRGKVPTGDDSNLPLYLAVAFIALALLALLRRRTKLQ